MELDNLSLRELQKESARALVVLGASSSAISQFNKQAHHNSQEWYKSVISWYIDNYGDLPSKTGPAKEVRLIFENV